MATRPSVSAALPVRAHSLPDLPLPLPPEPMALLRRGRPLKRWRYVGVFGPELMLCAGDARVGPFPQRWWAVATPDGALRERTSSGAAGVVLEPGRLRVDATGVSIDVSLDEQAAEPVEVVSESGRGYIWTRKRGGVPARGSVTLDGRVHQIEAHAVVDESAGYHERHTRWMWSAGVGRTATGDQVAWNLVDGVHDAPEASERTLWRAGSASELGPVRFAGDLSSVAFSEGGALWFGQWSAREHRMNAVVVRSDYRQPFGEFRGELPGAGTLAAGFGVMEEHDAWW